jgi:hypothetical protein
VLGEHQDSIVATERLRRMGLDADASANESAHTLGLLAGLEHAHSDAARRAFGAIWEQASRKRYRQWLKA